MIFSVTQNGKELDKSKYTWDESTKTFSTNENNLTLDFSNLNSVTFNTGSNCTFNTGYNCTFKTGSYCTFNTGYNCTFEVDEKCCLHYCWNDYFEVYKLEPNKLVKILLNGQLEYIQKKTETQIQIEKLEHELQILKEKYLKEQK